MSNTVIRTGKVRCGYVHIAKPRMNDLSGEEEFSLQVLIPKTDTELLAEINAMIDQLARARWGTNAPPTYRRPLRDADGEGKKEEHYRGHYFLNLRTKDAPGIVDVDGIPLEDRNEPASGDYFRVSMGGFSYIKPPPGGVSFGLNNVQWISKGASISGRMRAEEEFGPMDDSVQDAGGMMD